MSNTKGTLAMAEETTNLTATPAKKPVRKAVRKRTTKKATTKKASGKRAAKKTAAARKTTTRKTTKKTGSRKTPPGNPGTTGDSQPPREVENQAKDVAGRALHSVKDLAGVAADAGAQAYDRSAREAGKAARKAKGAVSKTLEKSRRFLRDHPAEAASLGIAGLGVVAALIGRKKVASATSTATNKAGEAVLATGESVKKVGRLLKKK